MNKTGIFFFFLLVSHFAFAQEKPIVLEGTIGKYPVIMEISVYDTSCDARYFYATQRKDIKLTGTIDLSNNILVTSDNRGDKNIPAEKLELKKTTNAYAGTWSSGNKKLPVTLKQVSSGYKNPYSDLAAISDLQKEDLYGFVRTSGLLFIPMSDSVNANFQWYKEKYSGVVMPRLRSGYSEAVIKKINLVLLEKHLTESNNSLECMAAPFGEYDMNVDNILIDKNIFSLNINTSYDCGGAHPDFGSEGLNFNGLTGELLKLDEIFWFGKTKPPTQDSDHWYDYRDSIFAPKIVELLKLTHPKEMMKPDEKDEDQCDYTDTEVWDFPNWHFTSEGLYVGAVFARAYRSCDSPDWSVIPYKFLKPYLSPETKLQFPQ